MTEILRTQMTFEPGMFYQLGHGHAIVKTPQEPGTYELQSNYNLVCMFQMWNLTRDKQHVGYFFSSGMKVTCKGAYIVTHMESKRGHAQEYNILIRCDEFVLIDYPRCGAMAISPHCNEHVQQILEGQ